MNPRHVSRTLVAPIAATAALLALTACGSTDDTADAAATPATAAPDTAAPTTTEPAPTTAPSTTAPTTTVAPAPATTMDVPKGDCPLGTWIVDPANLTVFGDLGAFEGVDMAFGGVFVAQFTEDSYVITADEFTLALTGDGLDIEMEVFGSTTGELAIGESELTLSETDYGLDARVQVDGQADASQFLVDAFHQVFGSQVMPYECHADGTMTAVYASPTGPATALHVRP